MAAAPSPARTRPRSTARAAYAARYVAKNVVAAGLADRCTIQVAYAIGVSKPLSVYFDLHGTGHDVDEVKLAQVVQELVNLSPRGIREHAAPEPPDLRADQRLWPFRPHAGPGEGHLHLGDGPTSWHPS